MTVHRYPLKSVVGDYLKAGAGLVFSLGILVFAALPWFVAALFGALALLFLVFALRTLQRHHLEVSVDGRGIATRIRPVRNRAGDGGYRRYLPWKGLSGVRLRYFGTRRHHRRSNGGGFMQLTVTGFGDAPDDASAGARRKLRMSFESSLDGFSGVTTQAMQAAREQGLKIDPVTLSNLRILGLDTQETAAGGRSDP